MRTRAAALVSLATLAASPLAIASTTADAASAAHTQIITGTPWTSAGASRMVGATTSTAPRGAHCIASVVSNRADAYRCFVGNQILDPAFKSPTSNTIAYLGGGSHWQVVRGIPGLEKHAGAAASPWRVQLANGAVCSASSGAGPDALPKYPSWVGLCTGGPYGHSFNAVWRATANDGRNPNFPMLAADRAQTSWVVPIEYPEGSGHVTMQQVRFAVR